MMKDLYNECKMNNIPVISTNSGNLKYLMNNYCDIDEILLIIN